MRLAIIDDVYPMGSVPARWIDRWARERPDDTAVTHRGTSITYADLLARTRAYTAAIRRWTGGRPSIVPVVMPTDIDAIAAMLGTLRAGGVVVPIDTSEPPDRRHAVLGQLDAPVIVARDESILTGFDGSAGCLFSAAIDDGDGDDGIELDPAAPARIIFTSGSTGVPKGFVTSHEVLAGHARLGVDFDGFGRDDRLPLLQSLSFAASTRSLLGSLLVGARLCLFDVRNDSLAELAPWIEREGLTVLHLTPNLLRTMFAIAPGSSYLESLRLIRLAADRTLPDDVREAQHRLPEHAQILVDYSSTDVGLISVARFDTTTEISEGRLPLGHTIPGVTVRVVDETGQPVPDGEVGDIEVSSIDPVPRPFVDTQSLFAEAGHVETGRFVGNGDRGRLLPDGQIDLVGRANARVKIRGYGVDLTEVEVALAAVPGIDVAAVVLEPDRSVPRLVAHLVAKHDPLDTADLRAHLAASLPSYAIPPLVQWWDTLPLTDRGKLDRRAMADASVDLDAGAEQTTPTSELEADLLTVWRRVLDVRSIGVDDDFFDVGGDSLSAYELVAALQTELDLDIAPASLLDAPTVRRQAELIEQGGGSRGRHLVSIRPTEHRGSVFFVHGWGGGVLFGVRFAAELATSRSIYGLQVDDAAALAGIETLAELAEVYTAEVMATNPTGPVMLVGWSLGGFLAWDIGRRLQELGVDVDEVVLLDSRPSTHRDLLQRPTSPSFRLRRFGYRALWRARWIRDHPGAFARVLRQRATRAWGARDGDEPTEIRDALGQLSSGWVPRPAGFAVAVLGAERTDAFHRAVWPPATNGPCVIETVPSTHHIDLLHARRNATCSFLADRLDNRTA